MAAAGPAAPPRSGLADILGGVKLECSTPFLSIPRSPASARALRFPIARRDHRSLSLQTWRAPMVVTRCDGADAAVEVAPVSARDASLSALEQFKFSAADRYMKEKSSIAVIGVSFHTAPIELREKIAVQEAEYPHAIKELCDLNHIEEAAVLSTCNRMEIYVVALSWHRGIREVTEWMSKTSGVPVSEFRQYLFILRDIDAVRHLFEVSAGLDSLVLGEGQIAAQVRQVLNIGAIGGLGKNVDRLFKDAISAGALVRSETNISSGAVSVSSAAVELALKKLPCTHSQSVRMLVIGAGKIGKLLIKHLAANGCKRIVVVNRSEQKVAAIGEELKDADIIYKPIAEMFSAAAEADVIFTSTSSEVPLFLKEHAQALPPASDSVGGLRLFIDISVPRNVGSCVSDLESVRVYNVDDLNEVVDANNKDRVRKATEAYALITERVKKFEAWRDSLDAVPTIKRLHAFAKEIMYLQLEKCFEKIGDNALTKKNKRAVYELAREIVNKLLDGPFRHLKCTGSDDRTQVETLENINVLNRMFDLGTDKAMLEQKIRAKMEKTQNQDG